MRTITWYKDNGDVVSIQNCAVGLESISQPEGATAWIEGAPEIITGSKVVEGAFVNGSIPTLTTTEELRKIRNIRLTKTDWTQAADSPLSDSKKTEWATYREALRNIPTSYDNDDSINDVVWPTEPS
jgi:hypothetical protein